MPEVVLDKAMAEIDRMSGRAAIVEPDGRIYILDVKRGNTLQDGAGVNMGMFLQPGMTGLEFREAGEYPHEELIAYVKLAYTQENSLAALLMAVDPQHTKKLRTVLAKLVVKWMGHAGVKSWLADRLTAFPLPNDRADIEGLPNKELKAFILGLPK